MTKETPGEILARSTREIYIYKFRRNPTRHKACRLFEMYGTDLPPDVIEFLQDELSKIADNLEINGNATPFNANLHTKYDDALKLCHELIERGDEPNGKVYELGATMTKVSKQSFRKAYKKRYPTVTT